MERLDRGLYAVKTGNGVYLSWRLLGTENIETQTFSVYRNGEEIAEIGAGEATNYTDKSGSVTDVYRVVGNGSEYIECAETSVLDTNVTGSYAGITNSAAYYDIKVEITEQK